jgi:hypothetical protein
VLLRVTARIELAKMEWEAGARRLAELDESPSREAIFRAVVNEIVDELNRRMGQTYTLAELAEEYDRSAGWCRHVAQLTTEHIWAHDLTIVQDAAFARFARDAVDYRV